MAKSDKVSQARKAFVRARVEAFRAKNPEATVNDLAGIRTGARQRFDKLATSVKGRTTIVKQVGEPGGRKDLRAALKAQYTKPVVRTGGTTGGTTSGGATGGGSGSGSSNVSGRGTSRTTSGAGAGVYVRNQTTGVAPITTTTTVPRSTTTTVPRSTTTTTVPRSTTTTVPRSTTTTTTVPGSTTTKGSGGNAGKVVAGAGAVAAAAAAAVGAAAARRARSNAAAASAVRDAEAARFAEYQRGLVAKGASRLAIYGNPPGSGNYETPMTGTRYQNPLAGRNLAGRTPDPMAGRTVEAGTRSLLEGMRSFIRGGGLRLHGR